MKPLSNYILIEPEAAETMTPGGLHVPETAKEKPQRGKVVAVGPGRTEAGVLIPPGVAVGDLLLYGKYSGAEVSEGGKTFLLIREHDAMAVL
jgi:chaperonin GroES